MSLYALGDLHLHFASEVKSRAQAQDPLWRGHEARFAENCRKRIGPEDVLLLMGDHTWGRKPQEWEPDLEYICALPGKKVLLRGNHDGFWDAKKTAALNERYAGRLFFLQNNYFPYRDYALVGTKGFTFEGPFYLDRRGRIIGWDEEKAVHAQQLVEREAERLEASIAAAKADGYRRFILCLHYPPTNILETESVFTRMAERIGAEQVLYAHSHGEARFHDSLLGERRGVLYRLLSGDYLRWMPEKILD